MRAWSRRNVLFGLAASLPAAFSCRSRGGLPLERFEPRENAARLLGLA